MFLITLPFSITSSVTEGMVLIDIQLLAMDLTSLHSPNLLAGKGIFSPLGLAHGLSQSFPYNTLKVVSVSTNIHTKYISLYHNTQSAYGNNRNTTITTIYKKIPEQDTVKYSKAQVCCFSKVFGKHNVTPFLAPSPQMPLSFKQ